MNQNLPYPASLQAAINRYRAWATRPSAAERDVVDADVVEEAAAFAELWDACLTYSYDVNEVMRRERL
jgi:hypothetical protein